MFLVMFESVLTEGFSLYKLTVIQPEATIQYRSKKIYADIKRKKKEIKSLYTNV